MFDLQLEGRKVKVGFEASGLFCSSYPAQMAMDSSRACGFAKCAVAVSFVRFICRECIMESFRLLLEFRPEKSKEFP